MNSNHDSNRLIRMTQPIDRNMYDEPIVNSEEDRDEWLSKKLDQLLQSKLGTLKPDQPVITITDVEKVIKDFV